MGKTEGQGEVRQHRDPEESGEQPLDSARIRVRPPVDSLPDSSERLISVGAPSSVRDTPAPDSVPPISSSLGRSEVEAGLKTLLELQSASTLRTIGRILLIGAIPLIGLIAVTSLAGKVLTVCFYLELAFLVVATVAARATTFSLVTRRGVTAWALTGAAATSLFHFGPYIGTGLMFVGAALAASLLLRQVEAYLATATMMLALVAAAVDGSIGQNWLLSGGFFLSQGQWIRFTGTSLVGLFGVLFLFLKVQNNLWRSLEKEIALRIRERRLVAEREKVLRGAASAQRLESLGRLAGGVAHDFNNSLVVIQCGVETLNEETDAEERALVTREIAAGVERAAGTARQLLSFAKRNVEELGDCDPHAVVGRIAREARRLLPAHIKLKATCSEPPRVAISETVFEQLILNLIQNARDALHADGGTISVTASLEASTDGLLLEVEDDGPGMSAEVAERVFEPFFTTRGDRGTGLGLATVWGIVHRHGGEVTLDTCPGKGTTVGLHLPALTEEAESQQRPRTESPPSTASQSRILVLEDEAPVRAALCRVLRHVGFVVEEAETVAEARKVSRGKSFALLISDGVVPDGGVGRFIHEFRAQQQNAPVILCSGYLEEDLALEGIASGECAFLAKPFSVVELTNLVRELLPQVELAP